MSDRQKDPVDRMVAAYEARIDSLLAEREDQDAALTRLDDRFKAALDEIAAQQRDLMAAAKTNAEFERNLDSLRGRLMTAIGEREAAEAQLAEVSATLARLEAAMVGGPEQARELEQVLAAVSDALETAVQSRDAHKEDLGRLQSEIAAMELRMAIAAERQEQMVATLEDAVATSFEPLETMFRNSGLDVDSLVSSVRRSYSGIGGPLTEAAVQTHFEDEELAGRFASLMTDMDRMNMMRIAATKIPYAMPVRASHRFTSGFGTRRDPKTGGRRAHNGIDLAAPRGTPIVATGEGVVVHAGWQSGFGKLVKIRHEYGFETLYAHLNKIHVEVGERIARGDHIGDMGTTGRSTGVHLHYEIRQGGKPVNPMTYIKAARHVF